MCVRVRAGIAMAIPLIERNEQWDVDEYAIESQRVGLHLAASNVFDGILMHLDLGHILHRM